MLDNWYLADPINQRGQTEYKVSPAYTIDRFIANGTLSLGNDGVTFEAISNGEFMQILESTSMEVGKEYTLSVLITSLEGTGNMTTYFGISKELSIGLNSITFTATNLSRNGIYAVYNLSGSCKLKAVKLELGPQQTLAHKDADGNLVLNDPPPNKALELLKCRMYYRHFDNITFVLGEIWGDVYQSASMTYEPMRANPTVDIGSGTIANIGELTAGTFGIYASRDELRCYVKRDAMPSTNLTGRYLSLRNVELNAEL